MKQKNFKAWKKQHKRRKRAKAKVKLYEAGKLKLSEMPRLARELLARKQRFDRRAAS